MRLRVLEHFKATEKEVLECFENGINSSGSTSSLDLWLSYVEYVYRVVGDIERLNKLFKQALEQVGYNNDPESKLLRLQARLLARKGDIKEARKVLSRIMSVQRNKASGYFWIDIISFEKQFGDVQQTRKLYQKAIQNCVDWGQYFFTEWLMFEREVGTLEDVLNCTEMCKKFQIVRNTTTTDISEQISNNHKRDYEEPDDSSRNDRTKKQKMRHDSIPPKGERRPRNKVDNKWKNMGEIIEVEKETVVIKGPPTDIDPAKMVFVSNFAVDIREDNLQEVFPNAIEITIPTDRKGKSRCFGYVKFESEGEVQAALKRDREPLDGRPLFVSPCQRDRAQRQTVFKYPNKLEENKLFVKGLPRSYTKEDVRQLFKEFNPTDVRLVTKFNGQPKGLAYVDFEDKDIAWKALQATNQTSIGEHVLTVVISAPPSKKETPAKLTTKEPVRHSKSRLDISSFVPRSVQVKKNIEQAVNISKTNADFRKMLLDK